MLNYVIKCCKCLRIYLEVKPRKIPVEEKGN